MDYFRQQSTYGHLPNFGMLFEKKLYLPNNVPTPMMYPILGTWNVEWDMTTPPHKNVLVGIVQQDSTGNIVFLITACYNLALCSFHDFSKAIMMPKHVFADYWPTQYMFDPLLSVVQLQFMSDIYVVQPPPPPSDPEVCKTDKPDVYHVYLKGQHVSSCLIPNIKISKFMYELFEHKNLYQLVAMKNLTLHEKSGKYIPYR